MKHQILVLLIAIFLEKSTAINSMKHHKWVELKTCEEKDGEIWLKHDPQENASIADCKMPLKYVQPSAHSWERRTIKPYGGGPAVSQ